MTAPSGDTLPAVDALSPVDGRYRAATAPLRGILSEAGLIRERIRIEASWFLQSRNGVPQLAGASVAAAVRERAQQLAIEPDAGAAEAVKIIESGINHDVKAVEYYVRRELSTAVRARRRWSWCTSAAHPRTSTTSVTPDVEIGAHNSR